jgi:hypothetical protein
MSNQQRRSAQQARPARKSPAAPPPTTGLSRFRRRHPVLAALAPVALVIVAIATMVVIKATGGTATASGPASKIVAGSGGGAGNGTTPLPASVLEDVTSVSPSTLDAVGSPSGIATPTSTAKTSTILRGSNGKPEITYIGAEYCPYCAAERWALVVALSRFGTFSGLAATHSSTTDVYPDTQTLSFYGSTYTSAYLDFTPVEEQTNQVVGDTYGILQTPTAAENALLSKYDAAPYTTSPGSIPFLDIGNRSIIVGASYSPQILQGLSLGTIARDLNDPSSPVAVAIDGTANQITASIVAITGDQPASVASSPAIAAILKAQGA